MTETVKSKDADPTPSSKSDELDVGLEDTFPASDPPASTQPGGGRETDTKPPPSSGSRPR